MGRRFFIDMDGVVAKWEKASLEEMTTEGFFASRKPVENVISMVSMLMDKKESEGVEVYILSSYLLPISMKEKIEWNAKHTHIPEKDQIYVPYGESKSKALEVVGGIRENDVLLDDFSDNLREWGGVAVKLYNGINGTKGTWNGFSVHGNMKPEVMVSQLDAISMIETTRMRMEKQNQSENQRVGIKR